MKRQTIIIALILLSASTAFAQQHFGQQFNLAEALPANESHEYVATDYISLLPGFSFSAASQQSAHFRISGTGVSESQDHLAAAFPNPANSTLNIPINDITSDVSHIQIYNLLGEKCLDCSISKNGNLIIIDTQNLKAGTYLYQVVSANRILTKGKFVKE